MSLASFSSEDKIRAGLQQPKPPKVSKPYVVEPYTPKVKEWERADHAWKQFRGGEVVRSYYKIGQVAKMFGIANSKLRFWLDEFEMQVKKNTKGDRFFTAKDVVKVGLIFNLLTVDGLKLWKAKERFRELTKMRG